MDDLKLLSPDDDLLNSILQTTNQIVSDIDISFKIYTNAPNYKLEEGR